MLKARLLFLFMIMGYFSMAVEIKGSITNYDFDFLVFVSTSDGVYFKRDTVACKDGKFIYKVNLKKAQYVTVKFEDFSWPYLYLPSEGNIELLADVTNWDSFIRTQRYRGSAALYNNHSAYIHRQAEYQSNGIGADTYRLKKDQFVKTVQISFNVRDSLTNTYFKTIKQGTSANSDIEFYRNVDSIEQAYLKYSILRSYADVAIKSYIQKAEFIKKNILGYIQVTEKPAFLASSSYRNFWVYYLPLKYDMELWALDTTRVIKHYKFKYFDRLPEIMTKDLNKSLSAVLSSYYLENLPSEFMKAKSLEIDTLNRLSKELLTKIPIQHLVLEYQKRIDFAKQKIASNGRPAKDFEMYDRSNKQYSLSSFKGKVVYIDVWASWCGPCIEEIPSLMRLSDKYKERKDIIFISLSLDKNKQTWIKKGLDIHKPEGIQFWAENGFNSTFAKNYNISSIPRFLLIDKNGIIISFAADSPSEMLKNSKLIDDLISM